VFLVWLAGAAHAALPTFENRTPVGFSPGDSTSQEDFVLGQQVTVRVDLDQAATYEYPVVGHFHNLERSKQLETIDVDGLRADVAVSNEGVVHVAWISQEVVSPVSTPVYCVRYARSENGGSSFTAFPVSVSGDLRFDILTLNGSGTSFSTVDLEVDSRGNPRVTYAFDHSPDGHTAQSVNHPDNVYFNYSENGGASWLPGNRAVVVNDTTTVGNTQGRTAAFPRMAIDQRDNIFITYVRGASKAGTTDDIMLARVNRETTPFSMEQVGSLGNSGSSGGVRLTEDNIGPRRQTGPDIAVGSGDVLHVIYFDDNSDQIEHKTLLADSWNVAGAGGWVQTGAGAVVDGFVDEVSAALETEAHFFFPTVVVDKQNSPDEVYALYKYGDATYETVFFNQYTYDNAIGGSAGWSAAQAQPVWSTATSPIFSDVVPDYNIELEWTVTERVSAVVDERLTDRGELHIVFTAGYSTGAGGGEHDIYYGYYNGASWILPEKVADDDSDAVGINEDGIASADVYLSAPALAKYPDSHNLYMVFAGGSGEGLGVDDVTDVNQHAYFKVLGRDVTWEDESMPVGGYQYDLSHTPVNPQDLSTEIENNLIYVYAADPTDGTGLGATGQWRTDGFLAGDWENVGTSLEDDDKFFEGRYNEVPSSNHEWGDEDDKVGLLVKLNVLGGDSATNVQEILNSTPNVGADQGLQTVRVWTAVGQGNAPFVSLVAGDFFVLGADIDIVDSNTAPVVRITEPDGTGDEASTAYGIHYDLTDVDDSIVANGLQAALYFSPDSSLASVQDIRIFGTLIADENDNTAIFASGTNDFIEGRGQTYTWSEPSAALKDSLFASIYQVISGEYYIYLVADDRKNPPVFTRSPGALTINHRPLIDYVDPAFADTVDTGVRSGAKANPYDLDFRVRDFDRQGTTEVQLFYSSVSGLSSVSVVGTYPGLSFALGKSLSGRRAIPITHSDTLTSVHTEFSWDVTNSVCALGTCGAGDSTTVGEGAYFIYAVASDSDTASKAVGQSQAQLIVKHSPSFTFYEPPRDTHRRINTGSQPVYTIQWQKGQGDQDFDDDATIDLYFNTVNPATINYEDYPDSLLKDADTRIIVKGLSEDQDGEDDMYVWDFRSPPNDMLRENTKGWLYAIISDDHNNETVALGGALTLEHDPYISLLSAELLSGYGANFQQGDVLRIAWDDYMVDDGYSTDNAYIRLYAASSPSAHDTPFDLETAVGLGTAFLINSSDGTFSGTITPIREDSTNFFDWNTALFGADGTDYDLYASISGDPTFIDDTTYPVDKSITPLSVSGTAGSRNIVLHPTDQTVAVGDTLTLDVMVQHSKPINFVQIVIELGDNSFSIIDQGSEDGTQPFIDLDGVFAGTSPIENAYDSDDSYMRFSKSTFQGELVGSTTQPVALARFQLVATSNLDPTPDVTFVLGETGTVLGVVGRSDPFDDGDGLSYAHPQFFTVSRGKVKAWAELEGRRLGAVSHYTLLDVHLRLPGSTIDIDDTIFRSDNDAYGTQDTVEVWTNGGTGMFSILSIPAGSYVLTVKDTSHLSARSDTFAIRNGETLEIGANVAGFYSSDLRGDPTTLLGGTSSGRELIAGDASEDNEINEDDINVIIAAWGTVDTEPYFAQADITNDNEVGAADLTVTTSNFGNSQGFGAPPVYKPAIRGNNRETFLEIQPCFDVRQPLWPGREIELAVQTRDLDDLAGFEFDLRFDPGALRLVPKGVEDGGIFADNPHGAVFESQCEDGRVRVIGARIGKEWSVQSDGVLARLRFEILQEDAVESIQVGNGLLLSPVYAQERMRWGGSLAELLLPARPGLEPNYPNPFNPSTAIPFALPARGDVLLVIFNVLGQKTRTLVSGPMDAGYHTLVWNGHDDLGRQVGTGVYFYLLETGDFRRVRKMTLIK